MKRQKNKQWIAAVCMLALSAGNIYASGSLYDTMQVSMKGMPVDISAMGADTYGVSGVWTQKDGSYVVEATADGFQSPVTVAVNLDASGSTILGIEVVGQAETDGMGTQITEESFTSRFASVTAPVYVADMAVVSPSGAAAVTAEASEGEGTADKQSSPVSMSSGSWNTEDTSPEAEAVRAMYDAGLLDSAEQGRALATAFADLEAEEKTAAELERAGLLEKAGEGAALADMPAEAQTAAKLEDAGLLEKSGEGTPFADLSAEEKAVIKMDEAGLTEEAAVETAVEVTAAAIEGTPVDAVAGATISSKAAATAVDNAYFFVKECVLK